MPGVSGTLGLEIPPRLAAIADEVIERAAASSSRCSAAGCSVAGARGDGSVRRP